MGVHPATGGGDLASSGVEVDGRAVRGLVRAAGRLPDVDPERTHSLLREHGIHDPHPGVRYPLSDYLAVIADLDDALGSGAVRALGRQLPRVVAFPADRTTVPAAMAALDDLYRASHRGGDVGGYEFRQIGDADGRMECRTPYPCALDRGLVEGVADAFADGFVRLNEVGTCREDGGRRCTYEISW